MNIIEQKVPETTSSAKKEHVCEICDYKCCDKSNYKKHCETNRHKKRVFEQQLNVSEHDSTETTSASTSDVYKCKNCTKIYKNRNGLWYHKKKCTQPQPQPQPQPPKEDIIEVLLNENKDFKNIILELVKNNGDLQKQMIEVCKTTTNSNINTINSHNKTFNMQVFLNEKCKDAMNIMDFVNSMTLELSDLEDVGEVGYVEGISKIIIRKLNELDVCMRPIHCSDFKREIMYVKDMDVWSKENGTFDKIRKAIKYVTKKNSDLLIPWIQKYPTGMNIEHPHNDIYMRLMNQAMGGRESFLESENKIIKKISKAVQIDKTYKY